MDHNAQLSPWEKSYVLGAGITGLACGYTTGFPVFEKNHFSGGICSSYYMKPGRSSRSPVRDTLEEDYRFEYGGGHWIFGNDPVVDQFISEFDLLKRYDRQSSVYLTEMDLLVPFPLQNNLRFLPERLASTILENITGEKKEIPIRTMYEWCEYYFGKTLSELFFHPFHELYTAGLWKQVQPQDGYKSPVNIQQIRDGAREATAAAGYNVSFRYPANGLNAITSRLEAHADIRFGKDVVKIDCIRKMMYFSDGSSQEYGRLISTLPLNVLQDLTGIATSAVQDPYTSVLVLNIGAKKGSRNCKDHWIYFSSSDSGFHRLGFYSNVDQSFLPRSKRNGNDVSVYVEKAYRGGERPNTEEIARLSSAVIKELQEKQFIGEVELIDPTWIDVAYTWSFPGSTWKEEMIAAAESRDILSRGRYGQWHFQGILDSIKAGLETGVMLTNGKRK